jgi:glucose-6-phosphate isomerase
MRLEPKRTSQSTTPFKACQTFPAFRGTLSGMITLDERYTQAAHIADGGPAVPASGLPDELTKRLNVGLDRLLDQRSSGDAMLGWIDQPDRTLETLDRDRNTLTEAFTDVQDVVVLGIGGSALGMLAVHQAFAQHGDARPNLHVVDNVDPDVIQPLLERLNPRTTVVNVVSKSGTTAETMAAYMLFEAWLHRHLGAEAGDRQIIVTTDPEAGILRPMAQARGLTTFDIPPSVGGRYSVLSPVGVVPSLLLGYDVRGMAEGARSVNTHIREQRNESAPAQLAMTHELLRPQGISMVVLMPYSSRLRRLSDWFVQLWAESLGKRVNRSGDVVHSGTTPIPASGTTDQHAQVQLFNEGPNDKWTMFIKLEEAAHDLVLPEPNASLQALSYLAGHRLQGLMNAEQQATAAALAANGRPSTTLNIDRLTPKTLGALMQTFMWQTALVGELMDIDAFNQPGVEMGKRYTYALMGRPGFESVREELGLDEGA